MAKTKQPPPRKPVKARGALPAPRVAPQRDTTPWHQKTKNRVLIGVLALLLIGFAAKLVLDARERAEETRADVRAIEQFERRLQDLNLDVQPTYQSLSEAPGNFQAGTLPQPEFRSLAENWVDSFRRMNQGIRAIEVPADLDGLQEAKALYVNAATLYIDAAKIFLAAADTTDPPARERANNLARNTFLHAAAVYATGDRAMARIKNDYELNDPPAELPVPSYPEEEISFPPPAPPTPEPGADSGTVEPGTEASPSPAASPAAEASPASTANATP